MMARRASSRAPSCLQHIGKVGARRLKRRNQAGNNARRQRNEEGITKDAPIHAEVEEAKRNVTGNLNRSEHPGGPARKEQSHQSSKNGEQYSFGQKLPHHAPPAGSKRSPRGELLPATVGPRQDQVRYVGTGNQQHKADEEHEDDNGRGHEAAEPGL